MNLPQSCQLVGRGRLLLGTHPLAVLFVGDVLGEDAGGGAGLEEAEEVVGDADVLLQGLGGVEVGAGGPAQQARLQQGRVGDAGVAGAEGRDEPGGAGALEHARHQVAHRVEVRAAEEERVLPRPRGGVHHQQGHVDVRVQRARRLAGVETYAAPR